MITSANELFQQSPQALLASLNSNKEAGLSIDLAARRLKTEGPNELGRTEPLNAWALLIDQFKSSVVLLLIVATIISAFMKEYLQTLGIIAALVTNSAIGFVTEYRAKVSLNALSEMAGGTIRVRRGSGEIDLPVRDLVRGDIVLLEAGVRVPADLCLLESASFSVDESPLTGESVPVWKTSSPSSSDPLESSIAFQGTGVLSGRAVCVVIATGSNTKIGKLGLLLHDTVSGETPLTRSLNILGHQLTILVIVLCAVFAGLGLWRHVPLERMLETSVALAVAAIPEGLPVIATLALAAGIRRMVRAKALVRRLPAVETLGCTTVICTDKTGTLTENKMLVTDIILHQEHLQLSGRGYEPTGELTSNGKPYNSDSHSLHEFLAAICLNNDARLENHGGQEGWHIHGDPTEGCLIAAALKLGEDDEALRAELPRLAEVPFDLSRKRMSTIHLVQTGGCIVFCKGSPDAVLPLCARVRTKDGDLEFLAQQNEWFESQNRLLASRGLRVLAVASRNIEKVPDDLDAAELEKGLTLLGLVAMSDRPKENVEEAIKRCQSAGIRIIMLTGDQATTALSVAHELGIVLPEADGKAVLTGDELRNLKEEEIKAVLDRVSVIARVTPEMKLDIVKRLQNKGHIVAMTGDGINDAPALRQSNIGIAMGQSGTDMAREASDLVITDDNFATIVKAVEQGRITYANISRAIGYLLTASFTSVIAITLGLVANTGLFLQPLQLLYLNLIMHVLPGMGIVLQKDAAGVMTRSPRGATEKLLDRFEQTQIATRSVLVAVVSLIAMLIDQRYFGADSSTTVALATLSLALILQSWSWLSAEGAARISRWHLNRPMMLCTAINLVLLGLALYFPPFQLVLNTTTLNAQHMSIVVAAAAMTYLLSLPIKGWGSKGRG
ncbi:MAG: cation-transporting P-type ATPase [Candidatus Obscuribacterales bacterium]|nr:cation-transporting P-type ATPase [Candidatus Obscuribacterales bacterium]